MIKNLHPAWLSSLSKADKEEFDKYLRNNFNKRVVDKLFEILNEHLDSIDTKEMSMSQYDTAAWAYRQAHLNGQRQTIGFVQSLFKGLT